MTDITIVVENKFHSSRQPSWSRDGGELIVTGTGYIASPQIQGNVVAWIQDVTTDLELEPANVGGPVVGCSPIDITVGGCIGSLQVINAADGTVVGTVAPPSLVAELAGSDYRVIAIGLFSLLSVATPAPAQNTFPASGNVGIGTTSPGEKLTVIGGGTTSYIQMHLEPAQTAGVANAGGFELWARSAAGTYQKWEFQAVPGDSVPCGGLIIYDRTANAYRLVIANGNVGIGTTSPAAALHVAGAAKFEADVTIGGNIAAKYQDVAECVRISSTVSAGTVVVIDTQGTDRVGSSNKAYDTRVAGVVSSQPGVVLGEPGKDKAMIAHSGRVGVRVDASYGSIAVGDLLVTSPTPGCAMRSEAVNIGGTAFHRPGTLIGKALESLDAGHGEILVLLTLQ